MVTEVIQIHNYKTFASMHYLPNACCGIILDNQTYNKSTNQNTWQCVKLLLEYLLTHQMPVVKLLLMHC